MLEIKFYMILLFLLFYKSLIWRINLTWSKSLSNLRFSKPLAKVVFNLLKNSRIKRFDKLWTLLPPVCAAPTDFLNSTRSGFVGWSKLVTPLKPRMHPVNDVVPIPVYVIISSSIFSSPYFFG